MSGLAAADESTATMEAVSDVLVPDETSRPVELLAGDDGVTVIGAITDSPHPKGVVIPWPEAVAIGRRLIELARARGDLS